MELSPLYSELFLERIYWSYHMGESKKYTKELAIGIRGKSRANIATPFDDLQVNRLFQKISEPFTKNAVEHVYKTKIY